MQKFSNRLEPVSLLIGTFLCTFLNSLYFQTLFESVSLVYILLEKKQNRYDLLYVFKSIPVQLHIYVHTNHLISDSQFLTFFSHFYLSLIVRDISMCFIIFLCLYYLLLGYFLVFPPISLKKKLILKNFIHLSSK